MEIHTEARVDIPRPRGEVFASATATANLPRFFRGRGPVPAIERAEMLDGPAVLCHPALVGQVLLNLLLNAAAAMSPGGEVRITREAAPDGACRLVVTDTGPGIDPAMRSRIFEPFFTTKAPGEGTGLGLALCFAIMELHGGRIWEEGEVGRGARFVMEFPVGDQRASSRAARTTSASPSSE